MRKCIVTAVAAVGAAWSMAFAAPVSFTPLPVFNDATNQIIEAMTGLHGDPVVDATGTWMVPYGKLGESQVYRKATGLQNEGNTLSIGSENYTLSNGVFVAAPRIGAFELPLSQIQLVGSTNLIPGVGSYSPNQAMQVYAIQVLPDGMLQLGSWIHGDSYTYACAAALDNADISNYARYERFVGGANYRGSFVSWDGNSIHYAFNVSTAYRKSLGTPFSISSASGSAATTSVSATPMEMFFSSDGMKFFYKADKAETMYVRNLTNAYDVAAYSDQSAVSLNDVLGSGYTWTAYTFSRSGEWGIFAATANGKGFLLRVRMTEPWELTSATVVETAEVFASAGYIYGVGVNEDDRILFLYRSNNVYNESLGAFYSYKMEGGIVPSPLATQRYVDITGSGLTQVSGIVARIEGATPPDASSQNKLVTKETLTTSISQYHPRRVWAADDTYTHNATGELFKCTVQESKWTASGTTFFYWKTTGDDVQRNRIHYWTNSYGTVRYEAYTGRVRRIDNDVWSTTSVWGYEPLELDPTIAGVALTNLTYAGTKWTFVKKQEIEDSMPYDRFATTSEVATATSLSPVYSQTPVFGDWSFTGIPEGATDVVLDWNTGGDHWYFAMTVGGTGLEADPEGAIDADALTFTVADPAAGTEYTITATRERTDVVGYTMGQQTNKVLAASVAIEEKLANRPTKSALDAGWWSDWTVLRNGTNVTAQVRQPVYHRPPDPEISGYWEVYVVSGDEGGGSTGGGEDATTLEWSSSGGPYTATRHRVAAPVPTKTSDLANDGADGVHAFASTNYVVDAVTNAKPQRIYSASGKEALDDKGMMYMPGTSGNYYNYNNVRYDYIGKLHFRNDYFNGDFYTYANGNNGIVFRSSSSGGDCRTATISNGTTIVDISLSRLYDGSAYANLDPTAGDDIGPKTPSDTIKFVKKETKDANLYYARFALESLPAAWASNTTYSVGVCVSYSNNAYRCITENSDATFVAAKWDEIPTLEGIRNSLSGNLYDFNFNSNIVRALADVVKALGGSVTNNPTAGN